MACKYKCRWIQIFQQPVMLYSQLPGLMSLTHKYSVNLIIDPYLKHRLLMLSRIHFDETQLSVSVLQDHLLLDSSIETFHATGRFSLTEREKIAQVLGRYLISNASDTDK